MIKSKHFLAVSILAIGAATGISAAPASAASFNGGQLNFSGVTSDFYTQLNTTAVGSDLIINFNTPSGTPATSTAAILNNNLTVPSGTNTASSLFTSTFQPILQSSGTFRKTSANTFSLSSNPLIFGFTSGTSVTIATGNTFLTDFTNNGAASLGFTSGNGVGTISNGIEGTTAQVLSFTISEGATGGSGNYGIIAGPVNPLIAVPEPFTIIGTLIGGTAALRMRKKLIAAVNK